MDQWSFFPEWARVFFNGSSEVQRQKLEEGAVLRLLTLQGDPGVPAPPPSELGFLRMECGDV